MDSLQRENEAMGKVAQLLRGFSRRAQMRILGYLYMLVKNTEEPAPNEN